MVDIANKKYKNAWSTAIINNDKNNINTMSNAIGFFSMPLGDE